MRPLQAQLQDIVDWFSGMQVEATCEDFTEGTLRDAWIAAKGVREDGEPRQYRKLCLAAIRNGMGDNRETHRFMERLRSMLPSDESFRSLDEILADLPPVEWVWPGWIARDMVTTFAARPGAGKSLICLDLAGRVMTGEGWPDGAAATRDPSPVIYVDGESIPQVHAARANAWDLPCKDLYMLLPQGEDVLIDLSAYKYQDLLQQMVFRLKPGLVIVDSLGAVLSRGENAVEDVRGVLAYLASTALQLRTAIVVIHHLRKSIPGQTPQVDTIDMDQMRGSGHIAAMSRVSIGLSAVQTGPKPGPGDPRKMQVIKSNLAAHPAPIGVRLEPLAGGEQVRVAYELEAPKPYEELGTRDLAAEWLLDFLRSSGQPVQTAAVLKAAKDAGFSQMTVYRARKALGSQVADTANRGAAGNCWRLASEFISLPVYQGVAAPGT